MDFFYFIFLLRYGHLTWEWSKGIRSYIYPVCIAIIYKFLQILSLDNVELLIVMPRIIQAILSSFADYRFYRWSNNSKWSLFLITIAWFWFYTASRTLSNTLETTITTIALSYYPWHTESTTFIWLISLLMFIRPTACIPWFSLCIRHIQQSQYTVLELFIKRYFVIGIVMSTFAIAVDCFAHNSFLITPWEFFKANVWHDIGSFYGTHPWYWYFIIGLPAVLGITTLPFIISVIETIRYRSVYPYRASLLLSIIITLISFSFLQHKEFRFILPLLPMCLYMTGDYLSRWSRKASKLAVWLTAIALFVGNILPAIYISFVHQQGANNVMPLLAKISRDFRDESGQRAKLLFLMPCHSTPFYSHIHENVTMLFVSCEPNFNGEKQDVQYIDETTKFYQSPAGWVRAHVPIYPKSAMPTHVILFDNVQEYLDEFLTKDYRQIAMIFNSEVSFFFNF